MARRGRKDSGELYEVFRKITSQKSDRAYSDLISSNTEKPGTEQGAEDNSAPAAPTAPQAPVLAERAFVLSYNTAVIVFLAVVIVIIWSYMMGFHNGRKKIIQDNLSSGSEQIQYHADTGIANIPLVEEKGGPVVPYTVEVMTGFPENGLAGVKQSLIPVLEEKGFKAYVGRTENGEYCVWIGNFPQNSISGDDIMEKVKSIPKRGGGAAFPNPKFVPFDKQKLVE